MSTNKRIYVLDALRGVAAFFVMLFHYTSDYRKEFSLQTNPTLDVFWGHYGVQLFFIISGFVIFMSINNITSVTKFLYKRFIRLYPTYWICLIITSLVLLFYPIPNYSFSGINFIVNLTMIQQLFNVPNIDGSYWSLFPELVFYAIISFVLLFKLKDKIIYVIILWLLGICFNSVFPSFLEIILNLRFGMFFIMGIVFYRIYKGINHKYEHLLILLSIGTVYLVRNEVTYTMVSLILCFLFYLFVYNKLNFLDNKILLFLGTISYPLYLIHKVVGTIIIYRLNIYGVNNYLAIVCAVIVSITIATFIVFFFEKPLLKKINR